MLLSNAQRNAVAFSYTSLISYIDIYSGTIPSTANGLATGVKLARARQWILSQIEGVPSVGEFRFVLDVTGRYLAKPCDPDGNILTGSIASMPALASGTAGYVMLGNEQDTVNNGIYASVGTASAEVLLDTLTITAGIPASIKTVQIAVP